MTRSFVFSIITLFAIVCIAPRPVRADDRATIADATSQLAAAAHGLARSADRSDDRAIRRKLAPRASELAEDLSALARRARGDATFDAIATQARTLARDAAALVELADEAEDRDERKALRAGAAVIEQGLVLVRKAAETLAAKRDAPARPQPMSSEAFNRLVASIKEADFDRGKLGVVQQAARANLFLSNQVAAVLGLMDFDDGRVEVAVAMWTRIVDPENRFVIFDKFDFESSKEKLRRRVGN